MDGHGGAIATRRAIVEHVVMSKANAIYARCCEPTRYPSNPVFMMRDGCGWTGEVERVRPVIVCLCGSTRFYEAWQEAIYSETMAMRIVLSVGFYPHAADKAHAAHIGCTPEQKIALDVLHKQKIDLADEILVLNVGGYIGESTRSEIEHAEKTGKTIRYLERVSEKAGEAAKDSGPLVGQGGGDTVRLGVPAGSLTRQPSEITHDDMTDSGAPAPDEPTGKLEYPHAEIVGGQRTPV